MVKFVTFGADTRIERLERFERPGCLLAKETHGFPSQPHGRFGGISFIGIKQSSISIIKPFLFFAFIFILHLFYHTII